MSQVNCDSRRETRSTWGPRISKSMPAFIYSVWGIFSVASSHVFCFIHTADGKTSSSSNTTITTEKNLKAEEEGKVAKAALKIEWLILK